ncbi:MAG: VanZ family protein [Acidobacteriota bacterium]|nr:VanZ family protein [Acidobacteriota bacterium]
MPPPVSFPTSRSYLALALAFVAFAIYGSLLPFEWRSQTFESAWEQFRSAALVVPTRRISRSDVLANVLLFVPIGFSLAAVRLVDRSGWLPLLRTTLIILPISVAVSCIAEFLQMFASDRIPSGLDIASQTVGCLLGIVVWTVTGQELTHWIREAAATAHQNRLSRALVALAAVWVFVNLAPFDITVDLGDLAARVRSKKITLIPFAHDLSWQRRAWDVIAETLSAVPLGLFGVTLMHQRQRRVWPGALVVGTTIVVFVECLQVFLKSHSADTGDAMLGTAGVAAGVWIGTRTLRDAAVAPSLPGSEVIFRRATAAVGVWCFVLVAYHWSPYDFGVDHDVIRRKVGRMSILPFASYLSGSYLNALNDLLTKLALAVPMGLAVSLVSRNRSPGFSWEMAAWLVGAGCLFTSIELGQLFLPSRIPDPTDVAVGIVGTYLGLSLGRWLKSAAIDGGKT